ncbi:MAG TPA: translocation/assembly module TamB domain-containing protein [Vicinamibacteria bacterium]
MSRRRRLLLVGLVLVATALYALWRAPQWGAHLVESSLSRYFKRPVSVAGVGLRLRTGELEIAGLRVAGLTPEAPPFLEIASVRVRPSLAPLRGNRIVLSRVRLEGLRLRIHAFPAPPLGPGGDDIPKLGGSGRGGGLGVGIERLVIAGGEFILDHERVPLDLDLPDFRGRLQGRPEGGVAGHLSFEPGRLRIGSAPELVLGTEIDVVVNRGVIDVQGARLFAENMNLAYQGRIRLAGRPQGQFSLEGPVDLAVLERHVFRSGLGFAGAPSFTGLLSIDGSRLRIEGRMQGTEGAFMGTPVERFAGWLSYDGTSGLVMRELEVATLGGNAALAVDVPPTATRRPVSIRGRLQDADAEGLLRMLFGWGELGVGTAATGELDVSWPKGQTRRVSGVLELALAERSDGRLPLAGSLTWRAQDGVQRYERLELEGRGLGVRVSGEVDAEERARLELAVETDDLAAAELALVRIRRALGSPEAQPVGVSGGGRFRGRWGGTLEWPVFEGRFEGREIGYADVGWGAVTWTGSFDSEAEAVVAQPLVARKGDAELEWTGRAEIGWLGLKDAIAGRARVAAWPVEDLVRFMKWDVAASGRVTGSASVRGRRSAPEGDAQGTARAGRYYGLAYDEARLESRWKPGRAEVTKGELRLGGGRLGFSGSVTDDGVYDGTGELEAVELEALVAMPKDAPPLGGRVSGSVLLQGTAARPRVVATLGSPRLFLGDEGVGALEARLVGSGDGRLVLDGRCRSGRVDLTLGGSVFATQPYEADLRLALRSTSLDPFLRALGQPLPQGLALVASGDALVKGPLARPADLRAEARLPEIELLMADFPVRAREPVELRLAEGRLELGRLHLGGEGTDLYVDGAADLVGDGPLAVQARGQADLRVLAALTRRFRGTGDARLAVSVSGSRRAPLVRGTLDLEGAGLRLRGFPHGVEGLRGRVRFSERAAELEGVSGTLASGPLTLAGQLGYAGGTLGSYDVRASGRGLALRYPEGLRSLLDAELRLFGDSQQQWVTGKIDVRQALYTRRYDVASELLALRRTLPVAAGPAAGSGARLDLRIEAPGTLRIDNNLATLAARAQLQLQGTSDAPVVTGRAEIERGRLYFQGRTYVIQRGALDFVNPERLDPLFDIEASTRMRSYQVTLRVSGTLERVTPTLTSDPPLSSLQILALLAGQEESEVASLTQTQARDKQGELARAGAATLAAGRLSESMGLEREAERLFGLNRFSIDPSLLRGAGTTPTARVTVGKRLTTDLNVLYSQDLRGTEERILAVEYTLTDRFSLLLTRTDPGTAKTGAERGWAFDVRIRQTH